MSIWDQLTRIPMPSSVQQDIHHAVQDLRQAQQDMQGLYSYQQNVHQQNQQMLQSQAMNQREATASHVQALLRDRLRGVKGVGFTLQPGDFLWAHDAEDIVYVFYLHGDRSGVLKDDVHVYPSDKLITQLRLLWT